MVRKEVDRMTFDERLAALGVDLSDLPTGIDYTIPQEESAMEAAADFGGGLEAYILHLTDIIDRMETRIVNLTGEREYLLYRMWGEYPCVICENAKREGGCAVDICEFEFAGVPEDWRAYDDRTDN